MPKSKTQQKLISICGLDCASCDAYIATRQNDDKLREETGRRWTKRYQQEGRDRPPLSPNDINCDGCHSQTHLFIHCHECGVRSCGLEKGIRNCGECTEYLTCLKIKNLHIYIPDAKPLADKIWQEKRLRGSISKTNT